MQLNSNERPTHVPCTRSSALSCTRLIGAVPLQTALCAVSACCTLANARRFRHKLSLVLPAFVRRAVPRPPCCPTPTLPPCRLSWLARSSVVHPRLPAGASPPASFVAPSHVNVACGHFLLHECLELLLTCAPGGYDKASALAQIFACMAIPPLALHLHPPPPPDGARFSRKR